MPVIKIALSLPSCEFLSLSSSLAIPLSLSPLSAMVISVVSNNTMAVAMAMASTSTASVRSFYSLRPPPLSKTFLPYPPFGSSSLIAVWGRERREKRGVFLIQCKAKSVDEANFEKEVLQSDLPVLVEFWAEWCGPCKLVGPIIDSIAQEYQGTLKVYKIETDSNPNLIEQYKVYGLPTLILFKDGKEVPGSHKEGAINKKKLKALLDELLGSVPTT